jgi:hypothetical protein
VKMRIDNCTANGLVLKTLLRLEYLTYAPKSKLCHKL